MHRKLLSCLLLIGLLVSTTKGAEVGELVQGTMSMSSARGFYGATSVGDKAMFAGGYARGPGVTSVVDVYDDVTGTWSTTSLSQSNEYIVATTVGDQAIFAGGLYDDSDIVDIYNDTADSWSLASLSQGRSMMGATSVGNLAIFAGGRYIDSFGSGAYGSRVDIYNAASNTWMTAALSQGRASLAATSVGDLALFAGGEKYPWENPYVATIDIYNSSSDTWTTASLSQARGKLAATTAGNLAFFGGGGIGVYPDYGVSDVVDIYNADTQAWSTAQLSQGRRNLTAATVGKYVIFAGGDDANYDASDAVDVYNTETDQWTTMTLSVARTSLSSTTVGNMAIVGGGEIDWDRSSYTNAVDVFGVVDNWHWTRSAGEGEGDWSDPGLWDQAKLPRFCSHAYLDNGGTARLSAADVQVDRLIVDNDSTLIVDNSEITTDRVYVEADGTLNVLTGGVAADWALTNYGQITLGDADNAHIGPRVLNYGRIEGSGTIDGSMSHYDGAELIVGAGEQITVAEEIDTINSTITVGQGGMLKCGYLLVEMEGEPGVSSTDVVLNGGTIHSTNMIYNFNDGYISGHGTLQADAGLSNYATIALDGTTDIIGDVENAADGLISLTDSAVATIDGGLINNGEICMELGSQMIVDELTLDGTLTVELSSGIEPHGGEAFDLFDWNSLNGQFSVFNLPDLSGGMYWDASDFYTTGTIRVVPEPTSLMLLLFAAVTLVVFKR